MARPPLDQVLEDMLYDLSEYVKLPPLPDPDVSVVSLRERPVAVGNRRGAELRGSFAAAEQKGGRLEAVVRFSAWGADPAAVDGRIEALHGRLLAVKKELLGRFEPSKIGPWKAGFLRLDAEETSSSEPAAGQNAWRKWADYGVLYEYHYQDADEALGLIARIPIGINSVFGESTVVRDDMARWDNLAAPDLELNGKIRRGFSLGAIYILTYLPGGWDGSGVKLSASVAGSLRERSYVSLREFRDAFVLEREEDVPGKPYKAIILDNKPHFAGRLAFPNVDFPDPIKLIEKDDFFKISYSAPPLDSDAVVYLRLQSIG